MHVRMVGEYVKVVLNDHTVVNNIVLENYYDRRASSLSNVARSIFRPTAMKHASVTSFCVNCRLPNPNSYYPTFAAANRAFNHCSTGGI